MNSIDWALAGRISVLVVVVGWALIAAGVIDVIAEAVHERKHEDALREDAEWDRMVSSMERQSVESTVTDSPPQKAKGPLLDITSPPAPPILNQSERWQERARKAEGLGFMDEEAPTPPRAA